MSDEYAPEIMLNAPYLNAAGALGFLPPPAETLPMKLGAFVTNPISLSPRKPSGARAVHLYPGGFLLHNGLPNPGLRAAIKRFSTGWARAEVPVWLHIIPANPSEASQMVRLIENVEGVLGIELGLPPDVPTEELLAIVAAATGELPLAVCVPLHRCQEGWVRRLPQAGNSVITLSAPRGTMVDPAGKILNGRLFGPSLYPQAMAGLRSLREYTPNVIVGTGIFDRAAADQLLRAGALAVQFDAVLWKTGSLAA